MELTCLENAIPVGSIPSVGFMNAIAKREKAKGIEESQESSDFSSDISLGSAQYCLNASSPSIAT